MKNTKTTEKQPATHGSLQVLVINICSKSFTLLGALFFRQNKYWWWTILLYWYKISTGWEDVWCMYGTRTGYTTNVITILRQLNRWRTFHWNLFWCWTVCRTKIVFINYNWDFDRILGTQSAAKVDRITKERTNGWKKEKRRSLSESEVNREHVEFERERNGGVKQFCERNRK